MEYILKAISLNGSLVFNNPDDYAKSVIATEGKELTVTLKETVKHSPKQLLYNYYMGVLIPLTVRALTVDGFEMVDEFAADHYLKSVCAKAVLYNPTEKTEMVYLLEKKAMTKERLRKFVSDCVWLLEERHGVIAPDAQEYKMLKETGSKFKSTKFNK